MQIMWIQICSPQEPEETPMMWTCRIQVLEELYCGNVLVQENKFCDWAWVCWFSWFHSPQSILRSGADWAVADWGGTRWWWSRPWSPWGTWAEASVTLAPACIWTLLTKAVDCKNGDHVGPVLHVDVQHVDPVLHGAVTQVEAVCRLDQGHSGEQTYFV